jgi:uncharacterized membrane protein YciS (DUF1049 family)
MTRIAVVLKWLLLLPILIVAVLLAVANDQAVPVHLNPFDTSDPVLSYEVPLYQLAFLIFALGALVGAVVVWNGQRRYRVGAHRNRRDMKLWRARVEASERQIAQTDGLIVGPERS